MTRRNSWAVLLCLALLGIGALLLRGRSKPTYVQAANLPAANLTDPDRACARCHAAIYNSYQQTSMARGSGLALEAAHTGSFRSAPSGVRYSVQQRDGGLLLSSERDSSNAPLDNRETLAYYIGSGKHGRTYLFARNITGSTDALWYEAPINWYTRQARYGMAPAFDNATEAPLALPTDANCLHCHTTGVAEPVSGTANRFAGAPFQQGGIGCAACHGDAAAHLSSNGKVPMLKLATLSARKQDSVCLQCHLEGDAMVQRSGRSLHRFQPGEDLNDTAVYFVNASSPRTAARASSQYEGLLRSACRRGAGERLTCTTCHDPHSNPAPEQRIAFYRGKCLQCHADTATFHAATHHAEKPDCTVCHMPARATSDISHEQNVDHDIEIRKPGAQAQPKLQDAFAVAHAVDLVPVGDAKPTDRELGLAYAQFASGADRASFSLAGTLLRKVEIAGNADAVVHQQLGYLYQLAQQNAAAQREYLAALALDPNDTTSRTNLAVLQAQSGKPTEAIAALQQVADIAPDKTAVLLNLALLQCQNGQGAEAKRTLQRAMFYQPDSLQARSFLATGDYAGVHCKVF